MADPFTLAAVGAVVLTEGIKFLYGQAAELITAWRQRRRATAPGSPSGEPTGGPVGMPVSASAASGVFAGDPRLEHPDPAVLQAREDTLDKILASPALVRVLHGKDADPSDEEQVKAAEALRALLEEIYGERLTLVGETGREPSGTPLVRGEAEAETVKGLLEGVSAGTVRSGAIEGKAKAGIVETGGVVRGVRVDDVG
jgi:hypothetical protein